MKKIACLAGMMMLSVGLFSQQIGKQGEEFLERVAAELVERRVEGEIEGLEKYDERKYGKAYLGFFRRG